MNSLSIASHYEPSSLCCEDNNLITRTVDTHLKRLRARQEISKRTSEPKRIKQWDSPPGSLSRAIALRVEGKLQPAKERPRQSFQDRLALLSNNLLSFFRPLDCPPIRLRLENHIGHTARALAFPVDLCHAPVDLCRGAIALKTGQSTDDLSYSTEEWIGGDRHTPSEGGN